MRRDDHPSREGSDREREKHGERKREREKERDRTSLPACMHMFTGCVIYANKVHFGIRHPWFLKPRAIVVPYPPTFYSLPGNPYGSL